MKSRIINGTFTRGYCMQVYRDHLENGPKVQLIIQCDGPEETTDTAENAETSTVRIKGFNKKEEDGKLEMYMYLGAGAGGVLVIIAVILIIFCRRKRSQKSTKKEKQIVYDKNDPDSDDGKLKDNILYVSADQHAIVDDGYYNTVDSEKKPVVNFGVSNTKTQHISTFDNSNNEYAVVDKGSQSGSVKHSSTLKVRNSSEKDMEMASIHVDQTYTVIDKTNREKADE
ncbi:uncharacterized protein LOC134688376 [Mytilus trossulus]|uniref:uncharacterized protein LOC134688376 n=1 Tax=Mytilus trossulus TaxID=6551 RepID=UPI003004A67D